MKILFLLLLLISFDARALDEFGAEEHLSHSATIPAAIIADLSHEINLEESACNEKNIAPALEASKVKLSATSQEIFIKPKAWCLCGAYYCPMWIYQVSNNSAKRIWSTPGTSYLQILDKKSHGYRQIKSGGGTAGHGSETTWAWDGQQYKVIKEKTTIADDGK